MGEAWCTVCWERAPNTVAIPCGHLCLCHVCAALVMDSGDRLCVLCRQSMQTETFRIPG